MNRIIQKDSREAEIERGIDLTITSPPYGDSIDYEKHRSGEIYTDVNSDKRGDYIKEQSQIFKNILENTVEGGLCCVVIGMSKKEDSTNKVPLPHKFATMMDDIGWNLHESIVWYKVGGSSTRFGCTIQHPYPGYYYPNQMHEEIQVWVKGDVINEKVEEDKLNIDTFAQKEISNNVWHIPPVPPQKYDEHPCPFPEEIPYRLIKLYSNSGDFVYDPMTGLGTTPKVAKALGRDYLGHDISEEYVRAARKRLKNEEFNRRPQIVMDFNKTDDNIDL